MCDKGISRNDPCPCGSGRKFKNCCIHKGVDRQPVGPRKLLPAIVPRPRHASPPAFAALGPFRVVDDRLKEIASAAPSEAAWKSLVERLSAATPEAERFAAYRAVREAGVLPQDAALFLFGHAGLRMPTGDEDDMDQHTAATLRRHGLDDLTDMYAQDRLGHDRRYERGRQFFFGPDEELAARLREKGIID